MPLQSTTQPSPSSLPAVPGMEQITDVASGDPTEVEIVDDSTPEPPAPTEVTTKPDQTPAPEDKSAETKPADEKEEKKDDGKLPSMEDFVRERHGEVTEVAPTSKPDQQKLARDYSDIDESDRELFKNMSNAAFNRLKPLYLEHKKQSATLAEQTAKIAELSKRPETSETLPPNYFSHPEAFRLSKNYTVLNQRVNLAQAVLSHWQKQLIAIRKGEDWHDLEQDKDGNIVVSSGESKATTDAEVQVMENLEHVRRQLFDTQADLRNLSAQHQVRYTQAINVIKEAEDKFFPGFDDPKHVSAPLQKAVMDALPAEFRDLPISRTLAKVSAVNIMLQHEITSLKEKLKTQESLNKDVRSAQPTKQQIGSTHASSQRSPMTYEEMQAERGR